MSFSSIQVLRLLALQLIQRNYYSDLRMLLEAPGFGRVLAPIVLDLYFESIRSILRMNEQQILRAHPEVKEFFGDL